MILQRTKINYMPSKSHVIIIIINTPGQIVLIYFNLLLNMKSSCCGLQIPFTARTLPFGPRKIAFQRGQFVI